jgi:hypothetical protein
VLQDQVYACVVLSVVSVKFPIVSPVGQSPEVVCEIGASTTHHTVRVKLPGVHLRPPPPGL